MQLKRHIKYESFLTLSENVGITINDVTRFGTSLMSSENIHSYDFAGNQKTASLYLTFFSLHLPYTFINDKWPDEPFQFFAALESNISNAKLITSEVSNIHVVVPVGSTVETFPVGLVGLSPLNIHL